MNLRETLARIKNAIAGAEAPAPTIPDPSDDANEAGRMLYSELHKARLLGKIEAFRTCAATAKRIAEKGRLDVRLSKAFAAVAVKFDDGARQCEAAFAVADDLKEKP